MRNNLLFFKRCVFFSLLSSVLSSLSIAFIPIASMHDANKMLTIIIPLVFWAGTVCEQSFMITASRYRKNIETSSKQDLKRIRGRPGVISVFKTIEGTVADVMFLISLVVTIVMTSLNIGSETLQYIAICCAVLLFRLRCTFNGINYRYIKILTEVGKQDV